MTLLAPSEAASLDFQTHYPALAKHHSLPGKPVIVSVRGTVVCDYNDAMAPYLAIYSSSGGRMEKRLQNGPGSFAVLAENSMFWTWGTCWTPVVVIKHTCNRGREWKFSVHPLDHEACHQGFNGDVEHYPYQIINLTNVDNPIPENWDSFDG